MKIKVSEASGVMLDWMVAKCEGVDAESFDLFYEPTEPSDLDSHGYPEFHYSTVWSQGGPIIEREGLWLRANDDATEWACGALRINRFDNKPGPLYYAPTPLIAACRCYVVSKLGEEVEVPDELA